jgi:hypothetical protein
MGAAPVVVTQFSMARPRGAVITQTVPNAAR